MENVFKTQTPLKLVHSFFNDAKNKSMDTFRHIFFSQDKQACAALISHDDVRSAVEIYSLLIMKIFCSVTQFSKITKPRFLMPNRF